MESEIALGESDTARGERDTAREKATYLSQWNTAIGERDYYEGQSERNYGLYEDALETSQGFENQATDRKGKRIEISLYTYEQRDADVQLSGLRGGRSSGGSNQSTRYTGGSLASGGGIRSSAQTNFRNEDTRSNRDYSETAHEQHIASCCENEVTKLSICWHV